VGLQSEIQEYHEQLKKGAIQRAYRGLMEFMLALRSSFGKKYSQYSVPGSLYTGYMDMTYFSIVPETLKQHGLKIAVVFLHEDFRFEVWLSGYNRQIQEKYWKVIKENGFSQYPLVAEIKGSDAILAHMLVEDPNFDDLPTLTSRIETGVISFIKDMEVLALKLK
jgi:hypothetical protein